LSDPEPDVQVATAAAMLKFKPQEALLSHANAAVRALAVESGSADGVAKRLADPDAKVRALAALRLSELGDKNHLAEIEKLLEDPNFLVRRMAAQAACALWMDRDKIRGLLKHDDPAVRLVAVRKMGDAGEIAPLLRDRDAQVRREVAELLGTLKAKEFIPDLVKLLEDPDACYSSATALGKLWDKPEEVAKLLGHASAFARQTAVVLLGRLNAKAFAADIAKRLKDPDDDVRARAASALAQLRAKEFMNELHTALERESNESVAATIEEALQKLRD
jgi:HEAT repeat protein